MSRPAASVVMPFAGTSEQAATAMRALAGIDAEERILADNSGTATTPPDGVRIVPAPGEPSPARARNAGAEAARNEWILFVDADTDPPRDLLQRYFAPPPGDDAGALAGGIASAPPGPSLAARYGAAKGFLDAGAHLAHPYLPRAAAANLLVRRTAFEAVGGFLEGVRAAEDTDFAWRLQRAGWRLEPRPEAEVAHRYRDSLRDLRRQWRGYAAGRAWLGRRYDGFAPRPALARVLSRRRAAASPAAPASPAPPAGGSRALFALDALLALEELAGFMLSNRPRTSAAPRAARVVLVADRFPTPGDPLADYALSLSDARVEAAARPETVDVSAARRLTIAYREDDGAAARLLAMLALAVRHPARALTDLGSRTGAAAPLRALAPAARRIAADAGARVRPLGPADAATAERLARLSGRPLP